LSILAKINRAEEEGRKKLEQHRLEYPGLRFADDEEEIEETMPLEVEYFYLFKCNIKYHKVFKLLRNYMSEYYVLDTALLLRLIDEFELPVVKALTYIPYIHSGYLSIVLEENKTDGTKDNRD
jgi:hypothetical protein